MQSIGKLLIIMAIFILVIGIILYFHPNIPFLGKLPGDIHIKRDNFTFYFPLTTTIIISILLTVIINIILKILGK